MTARQSLIEAVQRMVQRGYESGFHQGKTPQKEPHRLAPSMLAKIDADLNGQLDQIVAEEAGKVPAEAGGEV